MLVDLNDPTGVTLKRSRLCELEAGLASAPAGPAAPLIIRRAKGTTSSLRTERKPHGGADHRSAASQAVLVPRPASEQPESSVSEFSAKPVRIPPQATPFVSSDGAIAQPVKVESEDDEIVRRCLGGDRDAFEQLVRRHSQRVFNIIASFFRRRDVVEDIAQEVFVKSYVSLSSYTLGRSFEAWLARITVNACYDHLRSERRRGEQFFPQDPDREGDWLDLQMLEAAVGQHASAERQREAADISGRLLSKLAPEDRIVLILMDRDGFSVKDISEMTGWGPSKVKVRAFRARRSLRAAMKRLMTSAERMQRRVR